MTPAPYSLRSGHANITLQNENQKYAFEKIGSQVLRVKFSLETPITRSTK
jgi:uncharacterized protein YkuJ